VLKKQKRIIVAAIGIVIVITISTMWIINAMKLPTVDTQKAFVAMTTSPTPAILEPTPSVEYTSAPSVEPSLAVTESPAPAVQFSEIGSDEENAAFGKTVKEIPYSYDSMISVAMIRLDSDPQIEGTDISTFVTLRDETYTIFFNEAVDRNSVKVALTRKNPDQSNRLYPKMLFHWTSDHQLHVKVLATQIKAWVQYTDSYFLELSGIKTAEGEAFQKENQGIVRFIAIVEQQTNQLWRFSVDGKSQEQLTDFTEPYTIEPLDEFNEHLLLSRSSHYCGCDALYPVYYSAFDRPFNKRTVYPIEIQLSKNYQGGGSFIADSRGFFFELPPKNIEVPQSDTAHYIQLKDFIFGASFSKNHEELILAVGKKEQLDNYDLLIVNLKSNKLQLYPHVIKGNTPEDQAFGRILPFTFKDDGKRIYFNASDWGTHKDLNYYYDWDTKKVITWSPPKEVTGWTGFTESSDGLFLLYANGGLFKNGEQLDTKFMIENYYGGIWIPDSHLYLVLDRPTQRNTLVFLDSDTLTLMPFMDKLPSDPQLYSVSSDGKWLTLSMRGSLE
jgi:hypothetical protein